VSEFLVEVYCSKAAAGYSLPRPEEISRAADQLTREGRQVELERCVLVPDDETCFYLFEAQSTDAVAELARRCGLRFERLVEAVSDWFPAHPNSKENPRAFQETVHRP
jgi:hypothetical protein